MELGVWRLITKKSIYKIMANILNIDTSSKFCSIALSVDGEIAFGLESSNEMDHSSTLAPFVDQAIQFLKERDLKLEAVAVAYGPGSYTGLRIGLSLAKGLAYSFDIPLITLSSLEIMAVRAIFSYPDIQGNEIIVPMMDAGRMEVYAGIYDCALSSLDEEKPIILTEDSFKEFNNKDKVLFVGDGSNKFKDVYSWKNAVWFTDSMPHAKYMAALSEKYFREKKFADIAYATPKYLKEYQAIVSKNRL